jgi:predicted RecA/RadA family phage recombinase
MAKYATPRDSMSNLRTLKHADAAAVEATEVVVANGQALVAVNDAAADGENVYIYRGRVEFDKTAALEILPGEVVYWDDTAKEANKTATANTKLGIAVEKSETTDTTVVVMLGENR